MAWPADWPPFPSISPSEPAGAIDGRPLPAPALREPFAIGEALYDPSRMEQGVLSVLDLMGVGIYASDGTPMRRGDEAPGDPG
jgi:hypothetical protein